MGQPRSEDNFQAITTGCGERILPSKKAALDADLFGIQCLYILSHLSFDESLLSPERMPTLRRRTNPQEPLSFTIVYKPQPVNRAFYATNVHCLIGLYRRNGIARADESDSRTAPFSKNDQAFPQRSY